MAVVDAPNASRPIFGHRRRLSILGQCIILFFRILRQFSPSFLPCLSLDKKTHASCPLSHSVHLRSPLSAFSLLAFFFVAAFKSPLCMSQVSEIRNAFHVCTGLCNVCWREYATVTRHAHHRGPKRTQRVSQAEILIGDQVVLTDQRGLAQIELPAGDVTITVQRFGFTPGIGSVDFFRV